MAKTELYRKPKPPGYLGGYDWRATGTGLVALAMVNFIATQYIAAKFHYQPALGPPLIRNQRMAVYQPLAWTVWGWKHATSKDERIRRPFLEGEMIVVVGSFLCVGLFFVITSRRAQKLSANADDLHGSARWADANDLRKTGLMHSKHGVYVGGWCGDGSSHVHYLRHNGPEHILVFAPTRSGKGVGLVIPTLLAWEESAIVYDIKGEIGPKLPASARQSAIDASSFRRWRRTPVLGSIR